MGYAQRARRPGTWASDSKCPLLNMRLAIGSYIVGSEEIVSFNARILLNNYWRRALLIRCVLQILAISEGTYDMKIA